MLNKRNLHHQYKKIKGFKPWYFLAIAAVFLTIGIFGLRQNSLKVVELRDAVYKADEQNGDVESALRDLREYVYSHMNTSLSSGDFSIKPPIQLKHRYERLAAIEDEKVKAQNIEIQKKAEAECAAKHPEGGFNSARVSCTAEYMRVNAATEKEVPSELYKFDFVSAKWSIDAAGIGLLGALLFFAAFILRLAIGWWYRYEL